MIQVRYSDEPGKLARIRADGLAETAGFTEQNPPKTVGVAYKAVAADLRKMQNHKCCYCEKQVEPSYNDVEHFRPKLRADRRPGADATYGYWWLSWNWQNLLFACPDCNRSGKKDAFPLESGSVPLKPGEQPPGGERPLLPHPGQEDPLTLIRFVPVVRSEGLAINWKAEPRNGSDRGEIAIRTLKLNRPGLQDLRDAYFRSVLKGDIENLQREAVSFDGIRFQQGWSNLMHHRLSSWSLYAGLAHDVFDHFFPADVRAQSGVVLRWPGQDENR